MNWGDHCATGGRVTKDPRNVARAGCGRGLARLLVSGGGSEGARYSLTASSSMLSSGKPGERWMPRLKEFEIACQAIREVYQKEALKHGVDFWCFCLEFLQGLHCQRVHHRIFVRLDGDQRLVAVTVEEARRAD